jgi:hypothetical protein
LNRSSQRSPNETEARFEHPAKRDLVERVAVDIQETGKVLCAAAQVQMIGSVRGTRVQQVQPQEIIRNSGFGNVPKYDVFIALVKQPNPPVTVIAIIEQPIEPS